MVVEEAPTLGSEEDVFAAIWTPWTGFETVAEAVIWGGGKRLKKCSNCLGKD